MSTPEELIKEAYKSEERKPRMSNQAAIATYAGLNIPSARYVAYSEK
jgi:hypothetical protein